MIPTAFRQTRDPAGRIAYFQGDEDHQGRPRDMVPKLLGGDPETFLDIGWHLEQKYGARFCCTGVLGFGRLSSLEPIPRILRNLGWVMFPGLEPSRFPAVYYLHHDHGHPHIHFARLSFDLESRRRVTAYLHRRVHRRYRLWARLTNELESLPSPEDPLNWRDVAPPPFRSGAEYKVEHNRLLETIQSAMEARGIRTREALIAEAEAGGWVLRRCHEDSLTFSRGSKERPVVLRGVIARADWDGGVGPYAAQARHEEYVRQKPARLVETAAELLQRHLTAARINHDEPGGKRAPRIFENALRQIIAGKPDLAAGIFGPSASTALTGPGRGLILGSHRSVGRLSLTAGQTAPATTTRLQQVLPDPVDTWLPDDDDHALDEGWDDPIDEAPVVDVDLAQ